MEEKRKPGRPPVLGGKGRKIYINDEWWEFGKAVGNGNSSEGIRIALEFFKKHGQKLTESKA